MSTMKEDEIMARAIHAIKQQLRDKGYSDSNTVDYLALYPSEGQAAAIALRNIVIPISEILPEDPDEREAWDIVNATGANFCSYESRKNLVAYALALAAIKRGRALAGEEK
jgi:hypothetical protein